MWQPLPKSWRSWLRLMPRRSKARRCVLRSTLPVTGCGGAYGCSRRQTQTADECLHRTVSSERSERARPVYRPPGAGSRACTRTSLLAIAGELVAYKQRHRCQARHPSPLSRHQHEEPCSFGERRSIRLEANQDTSGCRNLRLARAVGGSWGLNRHIQIRRRAPMDCARQ